LTIKLTQHVPILADSRLPGIRGRRILRFPIRFLGSDLRNPCTEFPAHVCAHRASSELAFPQIALLEQNLQLARRAHAS